ncbi:MAG: TraR/DksA C4-type zinc finger protein [Candidatus Omnitrophota bacterium]|nr:MAG: TraR/DksA C4-type zinc finger protein [Candidatus Omnitrophota bacterium]
MKRKFTKRNLNVYKEKLLNLKEDILEQIKDISDTTLMKSQKDISGDMSGYSLHMADVATDNYEREFNLGIVSDERKIILEIEEAVKRIEDKTYGDCHLCKKPIAKTRLSAIPYARYCKKCKEKLEKENKI